MTNEDLNYLDLAQQCVDRAVAAGAEWCDVAAGTSRDIGVTIEKSGIKSADAGRGEDVAIRAFVRGGMGYAVVTGRDRAAIDEAVDRAVALAKEATADPDFRRLPPPEPKPEVEGIFDDAVAGLSVKQVVEVAVANLEAARDMEPDVNLSGGVALSVGQGALASSTGVALESRATEVSARLSALLRRGDDAGYFYEFDFGRNLADCDLETVAVRAVEGARRVPGAKRTESGAGTCVGHPVAGVQIQIIPVVDGPVASMEDLEPVAGGEIGEIAATGPTVTTAYDGLP